MSRQENIALARRYVEEVWNDGRLDALDDILSPDYVHHDPSMREPGSGIEQFKRFVRLQREAFPDMSISLQDQVVSDDRVVDRWTGRATHTGEFMGMEATGKQVVASGITIHRIENGRIAESWNNYDALGMMRQLQDA